MLSRFPCAPSPKNFRITFYKKERVLQLLTWLQNMRSINVSCVVLRCINRQRIKTSDQFSFYINTQVFILFLWNKRDQLFLRFFDWLPDLFVEWETSWSINTTKMIPTSFLFDVDDLIYIIIITFGSLERFYHFFVKRIAQK